MKSQPKNKNGIKTIYKLKMDIVQLQDSKISLKHAFSFES